MDPMTFITGTKIPVGRTAKQAFDWLQANSARLFDAISDGLEALIGAILWAFQTPHPLLVVALFVALTWMLQRSWKTCLLVLLGFLFILNQGYWRATTESLTLVLSACVVCMGIGVPIGIAAAHRPRLYQAIAPVLDLMQTIPSFVYLIPAAMLFGLGKVPAILATVIYATPPLIRLTDLGIREVDREVVEASRAFGATRWQILKGVQVPLAMPSIMQGINQTMMMALAMVVIASMIGARGVGETVLLGLQRGDSGQGLLGGLAIVLLAIVFDRITQAYGQRVQTHRAAGG